VDVFSGVCLFVSVFVRTITSEWLNVGRWNLAVRCNVQTFRPSSNVKVKGQGHQGQKKRKTDESSPLTTHSKSCAVGRMQQDDTIAPPGVSDYAGGKISACCLVVCLFVSLFVCLFVSTKTSERLNLGWWNLAVKCVVQKSRPSSNFRVKDQRSRSRSPMTKMKSAAFCSGVVLWAAVLGGLACVTVLRWWKNMRMLSSFFYRYCILFFLSCLHCFATIYGEIKVFIE